MTAALAAAIVACLAVVFAYLVYPGTPSKSKFMSFEGYIGLPKGGPLNVLDYLTLNGNTLFVTTAPSPWGALHLHIKNCESLRSCETAQSSD